MCNKLGDALAPVAPVAPFASVAPVAPVAPAPTAPALLARTQYVPVTRRGFRNV